MVASACGGSSARPIAQHETHPSWDGALVDLVPAGARTVVVARPAELAAAPAARRVLSAIASDERLDEYRQHTGIDPRELEQLVWAEVDDGAGASGSVLVIRGPFAAPMAVAEMGARMLPLESHEDAPFVRRGGHYQGARRDLIALSDHVLVAVTGAPSLTGAVLARVRGLDPRAGELGRPEVATRLAPHAAAPVFLIAPRPLALPPGSGIGLLLAREEMLIATATPVAELDLALVVELHGEFPPGADRNFRALVEALAESSLGSAIGMREALATLAIQSDDEQVVLRATLPAPAISAGLRAMFDAEIAELLSL
jgi:hypothetical protein